MLRRGLSPTSDPQIAAAIKRLEALAAEGPELAEAAALYRAILPRLHAAEAPQADLPAPKIDPDSARWKGPVPASAALIRRRQFKSAAPWSGGRWTWRPYGRRWPAATSLPCKTSPLAPASAWLYWPCWAKTA